MGMELCRKQEVPFCLDNESYTLYVDADNNYGHEEESEEKLEQTVFIFKSDQ